MVSPCKEAAKGSNCKISDYSGDKLSTLNKHIKSKHTKQKCYICRKEFKTSMQVISHKAEKQQEEEEIWDVKAHSTPKSDKETTKACFIFSESMLDEFL